MLALLKAEIEIGGDQIGQFGRVFRVESGDLDLLGQSGRELDHLLEFAFRIARQGGQFQGIVGHVLEFLDARDEIRRFRGEVNDAKAAQALDQDAHGAVGKLEHFEHAPGAAMRP